IHCNSGTTSLDARNTAEGTLPTDLPHRIQVGFRILSGSGKEWIQAQGGNGPAVAGSPQSLRKNAHVVCELHDLDRFRSSFDRLCKGGGGGQDGYLRPIQHFSLCGRWGG